MFNYFNKSDADVKKDVLSELLWEPSINASQIIVSANDGVITLSGSVPHYVEKRNAELAAQRVGGVKAVADKLEVNGVYDKSDEEIARAAISAIKWNYTVPNTVKVAVEKGWVTLDGEAEWEFQRERAQSLMSELIGVCGVTNKISLKNKLQPTDIKSRIEEALKRSAESESKKINVSINGDQVTIAGKVHSFSESEDARLAVWKAPGVMTVINDLVIAE